MAGSHSYPRDLSLAISKLRTLHSLDEGFQAILEIGQRAIPELKRILFERDPSGLYQVRSRAAEALGYLSAFDVLADFLRERTLAEDPVERFGDDVVVAFAARALAQRQDAADFALIYGLAKRRCLAGLIAALASYERVEAIPVLVAALSEDEARLGAEAALRSFGDSAMGALLDELFQNPAGDRLSETESRKCRSILSLIDQTSLAPETADRILSFAGSADPQLSVLACSVVLRHGTEATRVEALTRLLALRPYVDGMTRPQIDELLMLHAK